MRPPSSTTIAGAARPEKDWLRNCNSPFGSVPDPSKGSQYGDPSFEPICCSPSSPPTRPPPTSPSSSTRAMTTCSSSTSGPRLSSRA
ncbi:hypothetical protein C8Q76DRAFT_734140 [Earliella scabrosa]|nr:hypothetical protein C8Q76DRAFT_734140 [Earliella scabrosa]